MDASTSVSFAMNVARCTNEGFCLRKMLYARAPNEVSILDRYDLSALMYSLRLFEDLAESKIGYVAGARWWDPEVNRSSEYSRSAIATLLPAAP